MERYIATQFYKADSPESRILGESGLVPSEFVLAADAQRALDAEREKVKRLSTCGTDHSTPWWQVKCEDLEAQLATLRQLVEALPVVDGRMDVECGACYYIRSFVAGQYGIVCGLMTEQSTAMAIKALLEYRATLAAQDAGKEVSSA